MTARASTLLALLLAGAPAAASVPALSPCAALREEAPGLVAPAGGEPACAAALADRCDAGRAAACARLGAVLEAGAGALPRDAVRARELDRRACRSGVAGAAVADACARHAARLAADGDAGGARLALQEACAAGSGGGCAALAERAEEPRAAQRLRLRACDLGDGRACLALARRAEETGEGDALALLERACRAGAGEGCLAAGEAHRFGASGAPDAAAAERLLARGCSLGSGEACARLGLLLLEVGGHGREGRRLLESSCAALPARECLAAARRWLGGEEAVLSGAAVDLALLEAGCDAGSAAACARLGRIFQEGTRLEADGPRAAGLYDTACRAAHAAACVDLGILRRFGAGIPRDEAVARALFERACALGEPAGCRLRDDPVRPE